MRTRTTLVAAGLWSLLASRVASADSMDLAFERLVTNPSCRDDAGHFVSHGPNSQCLPDHDAFKRLVNQLGFAFAPSAMHGARTTGYGGFDISIEAAYTGISSSKDYWKRGTQGALDASTKRAPAANTSPDSVLQLYSVRARKGFGYGIELGGTFGFMPKTSLIGGGADARIALLEGFRRGFLGIFPDIAVGAGVRTITGTPQLQLTVVGVDAQISKSLPIQGSSVLTPWIGYQHLWIFGDSGLVDLTPATDAQGACGFAGVLVPGNGTQSTREGEYTGAPVCTNGPRSNADFNNNAVFRRARLERHRLLVGFNYRYEILLAGAQFTTDLTSPADAQSSERDASVLTDEARQWTLAFQLGAAF